MRRRGLKFAAGLLAGLALVVGGRAWMDARGAAAWSAEERAMAPHMHAFVRALRERPDTADPAPRWKPLLADSAPAGMLCSLCHGSHGERMERAIERGDLPLAAAGERPGREAMATIMEDWVRALNRKGGALLRKAVVCIDCHERDPRGVPNRSD